MTIPFLNVRPRAIKLKVLPKFPAQLIGRTGIDVVKQNGSYFLDLDYGDFGSTPTLPAGTNVLVFDPVLNNYVQVPSSAMGGGVPEAPNDGLQYGRQSLGWTPITGGGGGGIPEAPSDGNIYGRRNAAWTIAADAGAVRFDSAQSLTTAQRTQARSNVYAAPFDALAWTGMQINGAFEVDQERGGASAAWGAGSVSGHVIDGMRLIKTGTSALTTQQAASVFPGYVSELKATITTAQASIGSDNIYLEALIEGYRFVRAMWGTANALPVTIGFWVKSSVAGTLFVQGWNDAVSAGGNFSAIAIAAPNTPQFVTATIAAQTAGAWASTTAVGLRLRIFLAGSGGINLAATVGNTLEMTGLVVLPGSDAPLAERAPLLMRPYDIELQGCLRYLNVVFPGAANADICFGTMGNATNGYYVVPFQRKMRATPTMTVSAASDWLNNPFVSGATVQVGTSHVFGATSVFSTRLNIVSATTGAPSGAGAALETANANSKIIADARLV